MNDKLYELIKNAPVVDMFSDIPYREKVAINLCGRLTAGVINIKYRLLKRRKKNESEQSASED